MKKIKNLSESDFLKWVVGAFSAAFLIAAFLVPDRADMLSGLGRILSQPCKIPGNCFAIGGYAGTLLNMGLVGFLCLGLYVVFGAEMNAVATLACLLTIGFGSWGINILNVWPTILGAMLYCAVKKQPLKGSVTAMLFTTGIAPLISDLLVRYPGAEVVGFNLLGGILAVVVGLFIGFLVPAGLSHSPTVHKGFDLYSAALPVGMIAFMTQAMLFKTLGVALPSALPGETLQIASRMLANVFCITVYGIAIAVALLMGCTPKKYWNFISSGKRVASVSGTLGTDVFLMNFGVFGLFILGYYNLVGASFNGVTFGVMFCMLATCNSGSHPLNTWPMLAGYIIGAFVCEKLAGPVGGTYASFIASQSILVGACYSHGLSPVVDKYGWGLGIVFGLAHFLLVTSVPNMHGGFCLYNGGFTAALICLLFMPTVENLLPSKEERAAKKLAK